MLFNSRAVALLLATSVAIVTTAFLSLLKDVSNTALFVACSLSFASAFILIYITLEFLIFREINQIYTMMEDINKEDFKLSWQKLKGNPNPLQKITQEIFAYASKKQQEIDELKRLEVFRREFLADVSHELKTPIFAAQGFVHTLLDGAMSDKSVRGKFLKKAAKSLDGLEVLVNDLLTLSHMETGEIKMYLADFDIENQVLEIFDQLEGKAKKREIDLKLINNLPAPSLVYADVKRINQVMTNLIENGIKYGKDGGSVTVSFIPEKEKVLIKVEDDGPGIPAEHVGRIFERFYRIEKSRSKGKGGTGLGLAIVKHICEAHKTKVVVSSKPNKGTTFAFRLDKGRDEDS